MRDFKVTKQSFSSPAQEPVFPVAKMQNTELTFMRKHELVDT